MCGANEEAAPQAPGAQHACAVVYNAAAVRSDAKYLDAGT